MSIQVSAPTAAIATAPNTGGDRATYLRQLLSQRSDLPTQNLPSEGVAALQELRNQAVARLQGLSLPSNKDEAWRFTDLGGLLKQEVQRVEVDATAIAPESLSDLAIPEAEQTRLVFVNGSYAPHLSNLEGLPDAVVAGSLVNPDILSAVQPQLLTYLAQSSESEELFTSLNTAGLSDAAIVWVPKNQVIDQPIHLLFLSTTPDTPAFVQPRCLVVAESNSAVTLVEDYHSLQDCCYFTNSVTEIWVDENAQVNHIRLQQDAADAFHIGKTSVNQAKDSRYAIHCIDLGAALSRHNLHVFHQGEQVDTTMNGLTFISGTQLADTHSAIAYTHPYGSSRQLHKCIINDKAHAVFNGEVVVPKAAQQTNAAQLNRNLLLSPKARIDTKPQLEIVADNVKCTHGATISQLEADEVFYFQSRGIDAEKAQSLLIYAFAYEVLDQLPVASLRDRLSTLIAKQTR